MSAIDLPRHTGRPGARRPRAESIRILSRLALLELRRSPMPLMLPLVAALFWFDALRTGESLPPIWPQRASILPDHVLPDLGPVCAGMAAWVGGREQRRGMGDLAASTARSRWLRQLACWGGALGWTLLAYAACTAVIYTLAARVVTWGGPPLWPIAVTGLAVAAFCTTGFVAGAVFPSRFTAPLSTLGTAFVSILVFQRAVAADRGWALISPNNSVPPIEWGVFHAEPPDLAIVQTVFSVGLVIVLLGALGVHGSLRGAQLRRTASAVTAGGLAVCVAALALAATATRSDYGYDVPLLHDAATDRPIPYSPDCTQGAAIPVCVHPAFSADLPHAAALFAPLIDEVKGLPGAPSRVEQIDLPDPLGPVALSAAPGGAPVLEFWFEDPSTLTRPHAADDLRSQAVQLVVAHLVAPAGRPDVAQKVVEVALIQEWAGLTGPSNPSNSPSPSQVRTDPAVAAAAQHFAAIGPSQTHAWLVAHLSQLQAGQVTLEELP